jgi:uncharacterized protein involved in exopolysaccharide biosynthesis
VPILTLFVGVAAALVFGGPPTYVSKAALWETEKFHLPEGASFTGDMANHLGTQIGLLNSSRLSQMTLERLKASSTNAIPMDKDGKILKVKLKVTEAPKSSILLAEASSPNPDYSQAFLNALMAEFLEYKKTVRKLVSGDTLASISEQVLRIERDLKESQDALAAFQRANNLVVLQAESAVAAERLARLYTQLSDLQLEDLLLKDSALSEAQTASRKTIQLKMDHVRNSIKEWEGKMVSSSFVMAEGERLKLSVQRMQPLYDRLVMLLQNIDISRNIDQETTAVLEPACPAERNCTREKCLLATGGLGGLGVGFLLVLVPGFYRGMRPNGKATPTPILT